MGYDWLYFAKKAYALYPGVTAPVSGGFLAAHYARRPAPSKSCAVGSNPAPRPDLP